jgi:general secretion pathway protein A
MDYLKSIHCKKEPFATTSSADLFLSQRFRESFEKLSHSIRLGAGLHTVLGDDGTGKSFLIKLLLDKFGKDQSTEIIHISDPKFSGVDKFYNSLAGIFKGYKATAGASDKKLQEEFNTFIHKHCLAKKKSILLFIDDGQDIPDFCLQALDNFYDFHTDCRRFLQTVICGQPALQKKIKSIKSLNGRAALTVTLKKFNFRETREMINFHLEQAAVDNQPPPTLFTLPAQWALFRMSQGAPKEILDLCHLVTLTLVIENQSKAGWFTVLRCGNLLTPGRAKKLQAIRVGSLSSLVVVMLVFGLWTDDIKTFIEPPARQVRRPTVAPKVTPPKSPPVKKALVVVEETQEKAEESAPPPAKVAVAVPPKEQPAEERVAAVPPLQEKPEALEQPAPTMEKIPLQLLERDVAMVEIPEKPIPEEIPAEQEAVSVPAIPEQVQPVETVAPFIKERRVVKSGDTFLVMIQQVYGEGHLKPHFISQVIEANPQLANPHSLSVGDEIFFPELTKPSAITKPVVSVATKSGESMVSKKLKRKLQPVDSPELIGSLSVMPGDTLGKLIRGIYGPFSFNPEYTENVLLANPQLKNPDRLEVGEIIYFPDMPITPEIGLPAKPNQVASRGELPDFLGEIIAVEDETFGDMIRLIYGPESYNKTNVKKVLDVNPEMGDPNTLSIGQKIRFPTILLTLTDKTPEVWWIKLGYMKDLQNAYRFLRVYSGWAPPMMIVPSNDTAGNILYNIVLQEYHADQEEAQAKIRTLPASITADAKAIHGLDSNTYYYWTKHGG